MSVNKSIERRLAALEEGAGKVSKQDQEAHETMRSEILDRLCDVCRAKVEEMEQHPSGAYRPPQGNTVPKEHRDFQDAVVHAGMCPSCHERVVAYLRRLVDPGDQG